MTSGRIASILVLSLSFVTYAAAATSTSSFSSDAQAWTGTQSHLQVATGGAVDSGGYLAIDRNVSSPIADAGASTRDNTLTAGVFVGDLVTRYGGGVDNQMEISLYYQDFSTGTQVASPRYLSLVFESGANDNFSINPGTFPVLPAAIARDEWRQMTLVIDLDWTNGEAAAAGWNHGGSGTKTWEQAIESVTKFRIMVWDSLTVGGTNQRLGLDEITFATVVPEPASLALLGLGGLAIAGRRRD